MRPGLSIGWYLFLLPFVSSGVIAHAAPLRRLSTNHNRATLTVGVVGLVAFTAGMVGLVPVSWAIFAVLAGGALAGFSIFSFPPSDHGDGEGESDGGGWGRGPPPHDEPPPPSGGGDLLDWDEFDTLRAAWERTPSPTG